MSAEQEKRVDALLEAGDKRAKRALATSLRLPPQLSACLVRAHDGTWVGLLIAGCSLEADRLDSGTIELYQITSAVSVLTCDPLWREFFSVGQPPAIHFLSVVE